MTNDYNYFMAYNSKNKRIKYTKTLIKQINIIYIKNWTKKTNYFFSKKLNCGPNVVTFDLD